MTSATFEELQSQIQASYQAGDYALALELATQNAERFPEQAPLIYYWRVCMAAHLEHTQESLHLLNETLNSGTWYSEVLLRKNPSLKSLQGLTEFEKLIDLNRQLQMQDQEQIFPLITLRPQGACQAGDLPCELLMGLHANASTAQSSLEFWKPAGGAGWLVAVPQSSQAMWKDAYVWDDMEITREEIQRHFTVLHKQYAINPEQAVIAGHSMGGEVAIWLALSGAIKVSGFIAIGPSGPLMNEEDKWRTLIDNYLGSGLRGWIILGEADHTVSHGSVRALVDILNDGGIPCELEFIPGVGHDFDPEYETSLLGGLDFIFEKF